MIKRSYLWGFKLLARMCSKMSLCPCKLKSMAMTPAKLLLPRVLLSLPLPPRLQQRIQLLLFRLAFHSQWLRLSNRVTVTNQAILLWNLQASSQNCCHLFWH